MHHIQSQYTLYVLFRILPTTEIPLSSSPPALNNACQSIQITVLAVSLRALISHKAVI